MTLESAAPGPLGAVLLVDDDEPLLAALSRLLRPDGLVGIRSADLDAMTVTVLAGTPLHVLNDQLARLEIVNGVESVLRVEELGRKGVAG